MNVISFSLYGQDPKYQRGMVENIRLAAEIYPGWTVRVHHDGNPSPGVLAAAEAQGNTQLVDMSGDPLPGMFWRFLPHEGVDRVIYRDSDSRISERERAAVDEWVADGTTIHIMRDHPHHSFLILGGMWGLVPDRPLRSMAEDYVRGRNLGVDARMVDMDFLRDVVYNMYQQSSTVHCSLQRLSREPHSRSFPTRMVDHRFVGEIFEADGQRAYQWTIWRDIADHELLRG